MQTNVCVTCPEVNTQPEPVYSFIILTLWHILVNKFPMEQDWEAH